MNLPFDPLLVSIVAPLLAAGMLSLGLPAKLGKAVAAIGFLLPALLALHCWFYFPTDLGADYTYLTGYDTGLSYFGINLMLGLNGISMPLFLMAGIVGLASGLYAIQSKAERLPLYLGLLLVMQAGLMGVFASVDVFFFYFFHELALIPTFIMVGIWGGRDRGYAAMKMTIYLTIGAMLSLLGLIALYFKSGADNFTIIELHRVIAENGLRESIQSNIFALLLFGFGILVSLWPFHTWAPLGYSEAPSSAAMLHSGVLKKFGLYGLIQIALPLLPEGFSNWVCLFAGLAVFGNLIVIGLVTIAQSDLKKMVAYSSVMHMGYAFLGLACYSAVGIGGVIMMMVAHGLSVALLFLLSTSIHHRTKTFEMSDMGGLVKYTPVLAAFFVIATFASIGLPGLANFWGELAIFVAAWDFSPTLTVVSVSGVVISAIYGLRAAAKVFFGPESEAFAKVVAENKPADLCICEKIPALILIIALFAIGLWPKTISGPVTNAAEVLYATAPSAAVDTAQLSR